MHGSWRLWTGGLLFLLTWLWLALGVTWMPLWPSLLALAVVVLSRRVLLGLLAGALAGAILLVDGHPALGFVALFEVHLLPHFGSEWKVGALIFTLLLGGFATVLERSGALQCFLRRLEGRSSRRRVEGTAMGFGLICFFDGLANSLMVGRLFRSVGEGAGVTRARLAYIVDTTSAAVACVAFISTWIAFQIDQIRNGLQLAGEPGFADPYGLFFASIPFNFYCWFALVLLGASIWRRWDVGPMRRWSPAEERGASFSATRGQDEPERTPGEAGLWRFFLPLGILLSAILIGTYWDGRAALGEEAVEALSFLERVAAAFGVANAAVVMVWASVLAGLAAIACFPRSRGGPAGGLEAFEAGVLALFKPAMILVGAWMLSSVLDQLGATEVMARLLGGRLGLAWLPAAVFVVAALTSFTTGTSWGTMGMIMPLALPLAFSLEPGAELEAVRLAVVGVIAAVFSGAVFGDHASPLSDTTIVSSIACGIEPLEHVKTQLPYACIAAASALLVGFLPLRWISVPGVLLALGSVGIVLLVFLLSRREQAAGAGSGTGPGSG